MNRWVIILMFLIVCTIIVVLVPDIKERFSTQQEGIVCYESFCSKYTIDMFDNCINLGYESSGFLSGNYYYLCDGIKVVNKCLEHEWYKTNQTIIQLGMRCEEDVNEVKAE